MGRLRLWEATDAPLAPTGRASSPARQVARRVNGRARIVHRVFQEATEAIGGAVLIEVRLQKNVVRVACLYLQHRCKFSSNLADA